MHPKSLLATLVSACLGSSPSSGPLMGKQWSVMKISMVNLKTNMKFKNTMQFLFLYVWRNHQAMNLKQNTTIYSRLFATFRLSWEKKMCQLDYMAYFWHILDTSLPISISTCKNKHSSSLSNFSNTLVACTCHCWSRWICPEIHMGVSKSLRFRA